MAEKKLSLDVMPSDEIFVSGPARISVSKRAGRRVRVIIKAEETTIVTRSVGD